jgi:hypothetical protein
MRESEIDIVGATHIAFRGKSLFLGRRKFSRRAIASGNEQKRRNGEINRSHASAEDISICRRPLRKKHQWLHTA